MPRIFLIILFIAHVSSEETPCREGWYGVDCGLQCSDTCRPLETFPCNKETGKCSEGCKRGFYGPQCQRNCSCTGPCIQDTGDCIGDQSTSIPTSQSTTPLQQNTEESKLWMIVAAVTVILLAILTVLFVSYFFYIRRTSGRTKQAVNETEMQGVGEPLIDTNREIKKKMNTNKNKKNVEEQLDEAKEKIKKLEEKQKELIEEHNATFKNFGLCHDSSYHLLREKKLKRSAFLQCTWLKLDPVKSNMGAVNMDAYGKLSNKPDNSLCQPEDSFRKYSGTTTTDSLQLTGSAQYWEVTSNSAFKEPFQENETLLDFGFCINEDRDLERFTPENKLCCSFRFDYCSTQEKMCLKVFSDKKSTCYQLTGNADTGSTLTLNLGFLLHESGEKITCFNLEDHQPFHTVSIGFKNSFWPMFGLGAQNSAITNMTLVCGNDISMNDDKILMIRNQVKTFMENVNKM